MSFREFLKQRQRDEFHGLTQQPLIAAPPPWGPPQEPLNETMCGCNDIGAAPGDMGAHGREGDGGCECAGLAVRAQDVDVGGGAGHARGDAQTR